MANSEDFAWTGLGDGTNFSDPNNWTPNDGPPGTNDAADTAAITTGDTVQLDADATIADLTIDHSTLDVSNANTLTVSDRIVVGATTSADPGNPDSFLNVDTNATVQTGSLDIGQASDAAGSISLTANSNNDGTTAELDTDASLVVGDNGTGYFFLYGNGGNATVSVGTSLEIGKYDGSSGYVSLQTGAFLMTGGYVSVGVDGFGSLDIESGSQMTVGPVTGPIDPGTGIDMTIGNGPDGQGAVTVTDASSELDVSREIIVGGAAASFGRNQLFVFDGAVVNANLSGDAGVSNVDALALAVEAPDNQFYPDYIDIDGAGSQLNANGAIVVGVNGYAEIDINSGGSLTGQSYATGVSGLGQNAGSQGSMYIAASSYSDDSLKVGDAGTGYLNAYAGSTVTLGGDLVIAAQVGSYGIFGLGSKVQFAVDPDASTLTVDAFNVGGDSANASDPGAVAVGPDFGVPGGNGYFYMESYAVAATNYLGVWGSIDGTGIVDFSWLPGGALVVGALPDGTTAADFPDELLLNPSGTFDLDNGVIIGGYSYSQYGYLNLNGGTYNITPFAERLDDSHSVLRSVTIVGSDLTISDDVITLADSTVGQVSDAGVFDNILIEASDHSLVDLFNDNGTYELGKMAGNPQPQYVDLWDSYLTADGGGLIVAAAVQSDVIVTFPRLSLGNTNFIVDQGSAVIGTGAIVSDYDPSFDPYPNQILGDAPGHFSWDVSLYNDGLIDAVYNDQTGDDNGTLAILTNTVSNNYDGIFRADDRATLNIGDDNQPLDDYAYLFTNWQGWSDNSTELYDGAYVAAGGNISINGITSSDDVLLSASGPISTLSAVLFLTDVGADHGDLLVNGTAIEDSLTLITPSTDYGEGDLVLLNSSTYWSNTIEIQGLLSWEPLSYTLEDGTTGTGGALYLDNAYFAGPGLIIDAADVNIPDSSPAFISGNGIIDAPVEMDGTVYAVAKYHLDDDSVYSTLDFRGPVTGTGGQYYIDATSDAYGTYSSELEFDQGLTGSGNFVTFHGPNDVGGYGTSLVLTMPFINVAGNPYSQEFDATIQNFGEGDDIELYTIHAVSLSYDTNTDVLSLFDAEGDNVANLQFDDTTDITASNTFGLSSYAGDGGTSIRLGDPGLYDPQVGLQGGQSLSADVTESNVVPQGVETTSVGLTYSDADPGNTYYYVLHLEGDPPLGSLSLGADSSLSLTSTTAVDGNGSNFQLDYTVADGELDFLGAGEAKVDTFSVELSDGHKDTVATYQVTLHGVNDAPVIGNIDLDPTAFVTAGAGASVATGAAHPDDFIGDNIYNLLPPVSAVPDSPPEALGQAGAIWQQVDLSQNFAIHARLFFGNGLFTSGSGNSDGITFTLQDQGADAIGDAGRSLGVGGLDSGIPIASAVGVKFDTYDNSFQDDPDQPYDFSQFFAHGEAETVLGENSDQKNLGEVNDGSWHDLTVSWNAATHTLSYTFDGGISDSLDFTGTDFEFTGVNPVYAGFTAGSGAAYSPEQVEIVSFTNGTQLSVDPEAYTINEVNDQFGLTQDQVNALPDLVGTDGTITFSDSDQSDTHVDPDTLQPLVSITQGTVTGPAYWSGGFVGQLIMTDFHDTVNGLNGSLTDHFEVVDSDIAALNAGDTLTETFNVTVADANGGVSAPQTITVVITGAENQPVAVDDEYTVVQGQTLDTIAAALPGVLANDTEPDQHGLTVQSTTNPGHGSLTMSADGSFIYTPDAGFSGDDSFTYTAVDQTLTSTGTVSVHVDNLSEVTVTGPILVPTGGWQEINAHNIPITVSDADGDPIVAYRFTDVGTEPTSASLWFKYLPDPYIPQGGSVDVPVYQLGDFWVGGGSVEGTDTVQVQAFDGYLWSAPENIVIITDAPPVVAPATTIFDPDQTVALSSIFTATDTDGDLITQYQVSDTTVGGSYLLHNGVEQAENTVFTIDAADLGGWDIATASTSHNIDEFQIAACDGTTWSDTATIGVVTGTNSPPVVDVTGPELLRVGQWVNLGAALPFTVSDADGDTPITYSITDLDAADGSAQFWYGSGYVAQGGTVVIPADQISDLWIKGGTAAGTDGLEITVSDGHDSSAVQDVTVKTVMASVTVTGDLVVQPGDSWLQITPQNLPISVDADDPAVQYRFTDLSSDPNSDYLWFNHDLAQGDSVTLDANQLPTTLWLHGAVNDGTDMLQVEVYDGYQWSAPQDITVVTDNVPVISTLATDFGPGQTIDASALFGATSPDNHAIQEYSVTQLTSNGSELLFDHSEQAVGTPAITSDLSNLQFVTSADGYAVDTFAIQAFDGLAWSAVTLIDLPDHVSVVTATDALQFIPDQWLQFSTASVLPISVTDADNDPVVTYRFTDLNSDPDSDFLWYNGKVQGGSVDVPATDLTNFYMKSGHPTGIDSLLVQVNDGDLWSAPAEIAVITSAQPVNSNPGAHVVTGGTTGGDDVFTGTAASDTFIFAPNFGNDTVNNYTPGQDVIAIDHTIFATAAAAVAAAHDVNGNAVIQVDENDSITFSGISSAMLQQHQSDFHIV